jgi:hypothetical protein
MRDLFTGGPQFLIMKVFFVSIEVDYSRGSWRSIVTSAALRLRSPAISSRDCETGGVGAAGGMECEVVGV